MQAPAHYTQGPVHCIDAMLSAYTSEEVATFCRINAFKYLWRCTTHPGGTLENLYKAMWYILKAIELTKK
eukprot:COSAG01_NODE_28064_length_670_cov_0.863398_1_plen_70_part_00